MAKHGDKQVKIPDFMYAAAGAAFVIMSVGLIGLLIGRPWLFSSLGPTAFQLAEYPEQKSSRLYNVVAGHLSALAMGFAAVAIMHSWNAPKVMSTHDLTAARVWTAVIAIALTYGLIVALHASHPPAGSTALLVALGAFSTWSDAKVIIEAVLIVAVLGEVVRYVRLRQVETVRLIA